jgi:predicted aminopeptidase
MAVLALASCSTVCFYSQEPAGHREMARLARPVVAVLSNPDSSPLLLRMLDTERDQLAFAEQELGLPVRGQFQRYADLGRRQAVSGVFAVPEFRVEAKTWWHPLIGRLKCRFFVREDLAELAASELELVVESEFVAEVLATRERLAVLYKIDSGRPPEVLRPPIRPSSTTSRRACRLWTAAMGDRCGWIAG